VKNKDGTYARGYKLATLRTLLDNAGLLSQVALSPPLKGSECPSRFFVLRALYTTKSRGPVRHRAAGDGVGHHTSARPVDRLPLIGSALLVQTRPTLPLPLGLLSALFSLAPSA